MTNCEAPQILVSHPVLKANALKPCEPGFLSMQRPSLPEQHAAQFLRSFGYACNKYGPPYCVKQPYHDVTFSREKP